MLTVTPDVLSGAAIGVMHEARGTATDLLFERSSSRAQRRRNHDVRKIARRLERMRDTTRAWAG